MKTYSERGKIQVILGPMFSGKTSELIKRVQRYHLAGYSYMLVKYEKDDRYSMDSLATHDGCTTAAVQTTKLANIAQMAEQVSVIGIDEGQFFPDVVDFCEAQANKKKIVIVAGLDGTFQRVPFGNFLSIIPLAESVVKLSAVCMLCRRSAPYTKRITSESEVEVIGGADKYKSVCQACYESDIPTSRTDVPKAMLCFTVQNNKECNTSEGTPQQSLLNCHRKMCAT